MYQKGEFSDRIGEAKDQCMSEGKWHISTASYIAMYVRTNVLSS